MPVYRSDMISEEMKTRIASILPKLKEPKVAGKILSVTRVDVTRDLKYAKVYVSVLGGEDELTEAVNGLKASAGFIRRELASDMRLRHTPELIFKEDGSIARAEKTYELLKNLKSDKGNGDD